MKERIPTKKIYVGDVAVGGDAPISVQSMTYSDTHNVAETVEQINRYTLQGLIWFGLLYLKWKMLWH